MSAQRKEIDEYVRYMVKAGGGGPCPSRDYFFYLDQVVEKRKENYSKLKQETNIRAVSLCLYKIMESNLPRKREMI